MPTWAWILIVVGVLLVAALAFAALKRQRTARLQQRFGSEYDRTVEKSDSRRAAEADLKTRVERRERLQIRPLSADARNRYAASWKQVQMNFVDDPSGAIREANELVVAVMRERGYPMDDFDRQADDISVDYPQVVERYRSANGIAKKNEEGRATTEDQRQAVQHYRALFEELLQEPPEDQPLQREASETQATTTQEEESEVRR
jgi:hypothetical protein